MAIKDLYFTISEAAKKLNVSRQTIYRWIDDEKIPTEKVGGLILVEKKAIQEYVSKKIYESFSQMMDNYIHEYARKEFTYNDKDTIAGTKPENEYLVYIVNHKNGIREKVKIGGMDLTLSMGRKQEGPQIINMKFKDVIKTECRQTKKSSERSKKK